MVKKQIVFRFDSVSEGVDFMSSYEYPCNFIVGSEIYDAGGDPFPAEHYIELPVENLIPSSVFELPEYPEYSTMYYTPGELFIYKAC